MSANYDRLSERGVQQAQQLGEHLQRTADAARPFDAIISGPAERHRHTASILRDRLAGEHLRANEIVGDARLDEHDLSPLIRAAVSDPAPPERLASLVRDFGAADGGGAKSKALHRLTEHLVAEWIAGTRGGEDVEPWPRFSTRVRDAFGDLTARSGATLLVVTSVGPIAVMLASCLGVSPMRGFQTAWQARNTSATEFIAGPRGVTLHTFNLVSHLADATMYTHR